MRDQFFGSCSVNFPDDLFGQKYVQIIITENSEIHQRQPVHKFLSLVQHIFRKSPQHLLCFVYDSRTDIHVSYVTFVLFVACANMIQSSNKGINFSLLGFLTLGDDTAPLGAG